MGIEDEAVVSIFVYVSLFGILTLFETVDTQVRASSDNKCGRWPNW